MITTDWLNCYPSNWKGVIVPEAMAHPAKYSSKLIRRIYEHMVEQDWLHSGDSVVDPFGGVGLGALDAMRLGLNWYGVELEPRFHVLGNQNIDRWYKLLEQFPKSGSAHLLNGDSRRLLDVIGAQMQASVSSPPYAESIQTSERGSGIDYSKSKTGGKGRTAGREAIATGYGSSTGQLGAMKADGFEAAISSPPFLVSEGGAHVPSKYASDPTFMARHAAGNKSSHAYGETDGQLSSMKDAGFDAAVSSPPYGVEALGHSGEANDIDKAKKLHSRIAGASYGRTTGQLGELNSKEFDAAISSPPYDEARIGQESGQESCGHGDQYGESNGQLGGADDFWLASRTIVEQVYLALAPGGHAVWVVKDYVKAKQIVPFCNQWRQLCEAVGFETLHEHHASLIRNQRTQHTLDGGSVTMQAESKSFFRRLAEKNGSPRIDYETVFCMVKHA